MQEFLRFLGLALGAAVMIMAVKGAHKQMGAVFSVACGAALLILLTDKLQEAVHVFGDIASLAALEEEKTALIIRVLGISLLCEFAARACRDAGEEGIAMRVELGGKVMLLSMSLPLLQEITQVIVGMTQ